MLEGNVGPSRPFGAMVAASGVTSEMNVLRTRPHIGTGTGKVGRGTAEVVIRTVTAEVAILSSRCSTFSTRSTILLLRLNSLHL